jgi:hypothetical protein
MKKKAKTASKKPAAKKTASKGKPSPKSQPIRFIEKGDPGYDAKAAVDKLDELIELDKLAEVGEPDLDLDDDREDPKED